MINWRQIPGWCDFDDIYEQAVAEAKPGAVFVEVGVAFGRSAAMMCELIQTRAHDKNITFYAVDPWVDDWTTPTGWEEVNRPTWGAEHAPWARAQGGPFNAFMQMMREHAPEALEMMKVLRLKSVQASRSFVSPWDLHLDPCLDFVFIDGDHRKQAVMQDINAWLPLVKPGGVIAGHDYTNDFPGVKAAVQEVLGVEERDFQVRRSSWWKRIAV